MSQQVYTSRHHPGDQGAARVYAQAMTEPLVLAMTALMVAATGGALMGSDPARWLVWAVPLALAAAAAVTLFRLRSTPVELRLYSDSVAVRTIWEVATDQPGQPTRILPPRRVRGGVDVGVGRNVLTLLAEDWPDLDRLHRALTETAYRVPPELP